jgi:hypothetical protein
MKKFLFLILLALVTSFSAFAGKDPMKFGKVSMDELRMAVYGADTSAPAVILCDYGYFDPGNFNFTQLTRIKILRKAGYEWANKTFPAYRNASVKGVTVNLENGKAVETDLKSESIFTENISGRIKRIRIAMPNVKVGSVIDIKFMFDGIPDAWEFQQEIPVKHSELDLVDNLYITVRKNLSGFVPLTVNEKGHWVAENMPAFKPEPHITCSKNYITKIDFDIYEVRFRNFYEAYTTTWEDLCKHLDDDDYFGIALRNDGYLSRAAKAILAKADNDNDRLRLAHEYIKGYKWNKYKSLYTSETSIKSAFDKKSGNSADINLALVQLLTKMGFTAKPVLLSTRDNGFLSPVNPSLNKLNYVIASVMVGGQQVLMDATEENAPYYLLPERDINLFGYLYDRKQSSSVELTALKKDKSLVFYNLTMDENYQLSGTMNFRRFDYAALDFRNKYKSYPGKQAYLEEMLGEYPGLRIKNSVIENIDSIYLPVKDQYEIILKNAVDEIDGNLYIYPMLLHRLKENPFKIDQRKYPVDYIHQVDDTYSITINIPENFRVISLPETVKMRLEGNGAYFMYQITGVGKAIQINYRFGINKTIFGEEEYKDLKEFFNQIVVKHSEPIILKAG